MEQLYLRRKVQKRRNEKSSERYSLYKVEEREKGQ